MDDQFSEAVSAFLDGEPVDPDALSAALDDAPTRQALVEFVRIREATRQVDGPLPASLAALRASRPWWRRPVLPLPAAAALVLVVLLAGLLMPRAWQAEGPPEPPTPTRTLTFEPGVDWQPGPAEWTP